MNTKGVYALSYIIRVFVDLGGYIARYTRGSSLYTSMRMGRCRTRRIRAIGGAMSARSACLGLSRWRESCLPLLLDMGLSTAILVCLCMSTGYFGPRPSCRLRLLHPLHESHFLHQPLACRRRTAGFDGAMARKCKEGRLLR
jgi:hypothetical protein